MKHISILPCTLFLVSSFTGVGAEPSEKSERPNIIFIFSDDHATQAIGAYGHELTRYAPTPNLDKIAEQGMRFDRCLVTNSICGPSRATILTGKYSHLNGFYFNAGPDFDGSQETFPKRLRNAGYQTSIVGKWHLGSEPTGFDHWEVLPGQGYYYHPEFYTPDGKINEKGYVTDVVTDKAIEWLENQRDKDKPFMLMVQHKAPHREWSPPIEYLDLFDDIEFPYPETLFDDYRGRTTAAHDQDMSIEISMEAKLDLKANAREHGNGFYNRVYSRLDKEEKVAWDKVLDKRDKEYNDPGLKGVALEKWKYQIYVKEFLRCIRSLDDNVGRIQEYLEEKGLDENTVVIYSSDQGFYLGEHGWFDKRFMYDESYRTPLLISWPGKVKPGSVNNDLVSNLDFARTFLDIAGAEAHPSMQGKSLLPLMEGKEIAWRKYHYYHYYEYPGWHSVRRHEGVYDGRYKLIHFYDLGEWELFDMKKDPMELNSVYHNPSYATVLNRMKKALENKKEELKVPEGIPEPRGGENPFYYYSNQRKELEKTINKNN